MGKSKTKMLQELGYDHVDVHQSEVDHHVMKENAVFLLDLAPLTNSGKKNAGTCDSDKFLKSCCKSNQVINEHTHSIMLICFLESLSTSPWYEGSGRSPPTPPGSMWQPAPPFQCLPALGAAPKINAKADAARYHSLGRPPAPAVAPIVSSK